MKPAEHRSETAAAVQNRSESDPSGTIRFGIAERSALREIFCVLLCFAGYLVLAQMAGTIFQWSRLVSALAEFVPYCFVLAGIAYGGRALARRDKQTLLMVSCLACVFVVLAFDVTKNLAWFDSIPVVGRNSRVRNDIASVAIMVAIATFPAASYFMMKELMLAKRQLDEQVERLQDALNHVRRLQGLLPICMYCHKIRTDQKSWQRIELYISEHSDATFTHGLCPECAQKHFPELNLGPEGNSKV